MTDGFVILALVAAVVLWCAVRYLGTRAVYRRKARLSNEILRHGNRPSAIVNAAWTGTDYTGLNAELDNWGSKIRGLAQSHKASPFLHDHPENLPRALAVLDDTLSILMRCVPAEERPEGTRMRKLRGAINDMLDTLEGIGLAPGAEVPARPHFPDRIAKHMQESGFESEGGFILRRSLMLAWVRSSALNWYDEQPTFHIGTGVGGRPMTAKE